MNAEHPDIRNLNFAAATVKLQNKASTSERAGWPFDMGFVEKRKKYDLKAVRPLAEPAFFPCLRDVGYAIIIQCGLRDDQSLQKEGLAV